MGSKLTKRDVDSTVLPRAGDSFLWCGELRGFGVRVSPTGRKTFVVAYRTKRGQSRRFSLGTYPTLTVDQARERAQRELVRVLDGQDPARERRVARNYETVGDLCTNYLNACQAGDVLSRGKPKKPSTLVSDASRIRGHIVPLLGTRPLPELTRHDVQRMYRDIIAGKTRRDIKTAKGRSIVEGGVGSAVKAVRLLSAIMTFAMKEGLVQSNPCLAVEVARDGKRSRFLSRAEYRALGAALCKADSLGIERGLAAAIFGIALTGCRKGEMMRLRPADVDQEGRCLRLSDTKTGPQLRPCGRVALDLLAELGADGDVWLFPSSRTDGPAGNVDDALAQFCKAAKLEGVTCHTLRHSYATVANELNYSELTIAGLLGHSASSVTASYAHHVDYALAGAADQVAGVIAERMGMKPLD